MQKENIDLRTKTLQKIEICMDRFARRVNISDIEEN